jgi:hypothetical protein
VKVGRSSGALVPFVAILFAGALAGAQEPAATPAAKPELSPIPAIPGIPAARETRPARPAPMQPVTGLPMPAVPGISRSAALKAEKIRPEFQPGNTYRFVVKTELQDATGGGFTLEHQARYDAKVRVDGKPGVVLKARTERLDLVLSSRGSTVSYQSLKPEDQETPLGRHLRATLNRSVDLTLDPRGRIDAVKEATGGDASSLLAGVPSFGPEELAQWITLLTQGYTDKPVGPGDGWTFRGARSVGDAGVANFDLGYRHAGPAAFEGNACIAIDCSGTLAGSLPEVDGAGPAAAFQASRLQGRIFYDPLDRMVRFAEQEVELWITRPSAVPPATGLIPAEPVASPAAALDPAAAAAAPVNQAAVRETTTVRLLHVVPTP